jgi:hypothetical protein
MFKVGDRVIPKLDIWKYIKSEYAKCGTTDLPEDPPEFTVMEILKYQNGTFKYRCNCRLCGINVVIPPEHLLKAP